MSTYAIKSDIETNYYTPDGVKNLVIKAGTYTPADEVEAQILSDLALTDVVAVAADKPVKTKTPTPVEE